MQKIIKTFFKRALNFELEYRFFIIFDLPTQCIGITKKFPVIYINPI